jgi:hypothetical protein
VRPSLRTALSRSKRLEAASRIELLFTVLQTVASPLGHAALTLPAREIAIRGFARQT